MGMIDTVENKNLMEAVDGRTRLAGSNKMEILLFSLGSRENFGINVFKVREVCKTPPLTITPNMPPGMEGVISLRGNVIPVLSLDKFVHTEIPPAGLGSTMIVTEYNRRTLGFLVHGVDRIIRVDWDMVKAPENMLAGKEGLITAITELPAGGLVSILDVEQILANAFGEMPVSDFASVADADEMCIYFVDDSAMARKKIVEVLNKLGVQHKHANNGLEGWERLQGMAAQAQREGTELKRMIKLILLDAEMPEMDGYVLTRNIKADRRFKGIPVVMHSSLSSDANRAMGRRVGVDAYVAKFDTGALAETLRPFLVS